MQDRYTGDLGDFSKLGILRTLQTAGLSIGVNWYLTPDENHNGDGRHVKYLDQEEYKAFRILQHTKIYQHYHIFCRNLLSVQKYSSQIHLLRYIMCVFVKKYLYLVYNKD